MMKRTGLLSVVLAGGAGLVLTVVLVLLIALPVAAGPSAQDSWTPIPTPTLYPLPPDGPDYQLTIVGGDRSPQTFPGQEVDGVTFGETTVETEFPDRLTFRAVISTDREIDQVNMIRTYRNGAERALDAHWDEETQAWTANWSVDGQIPAWAEFAFRWCVRDMAGETICTEPYLLTLVDPTQKWFRVESDYALLYWYGFSEDYPNYVADEFVRLVAMTHQRRVDGYGQISYTPIVVLYPDESSLSDRVKDLITEGWFVGSMATHGLAFGFLLPPELPDLLAECSLVPPLEERTFDWRLRATLNYVAAGGIADLFQAEIQGRPGGCTGYAGWECVNYGPNVWGNGQWVWFSGEWLWNSDQRLRNLAATEAIPSVTSNIIDPLLSSDGCVSVAVDAGASFINWLVYNYGIETHRQIVELMRYNADGSRGMNFQDAIEQATGESFADLDREWRAYLELPPLE
jgi:hypothetical protein